jgi:hypothetical protein
MESPAISASGVGAVTFGVGGAATGAWYASACWGVGLRGGVCMRLSVGLVVVLLDGCVVEAAAAPFWYGGCDS